MDEHEPIPVPAITVPREPDDPTDELEAAIALPAFVGDLTGDDVVIDLRDPAAARVERRADAAPPVEPLADALPPWPDDVAEERDAPAVLDVSPDDIVEVHGVGLEPVALPAPGAALPDTTARPLPARRTDDHVGTWVHEPEPRWRTTQLVGAVVAATVAGLVLGLLVASLGGGGGTPRAAAPPVSSVVVTSATPAGRVGAATAAATASGVPGPDVRRTGLDAATSTGPGSYAKPLPVGVRATLADPTRGDLDVIVIGVDDDPWPELRAVNAFNAPPPANLRSVMVTVGVVYRAGTEQRTFEGVSGALVFSAFGSAGREHRDAEYPVVAPTPLDRSADLLDGGSVYGNLVFAVEADSRAVTLRVQRTGCAATCGEVWFTLR